MTALGYLAGVGAVLVVLLGATSVGVAGRRLLVPEWSGAMGALTVVVFVNSFLVVVGELLGSIGLFSRVPLVVTSAAAGAAALAVLRRRPAVAVPSPGFVRPSFSFVSVAASLCALLVLSQGAVAVYLAMHLGNTFIDALEYHLTMAAQFASSHHTTHIVQVSAQAPVSWYPFNDELVHGIGISLFGRDTLSMFLGVVDAGAMLLAAWCVGSADGRGPITLITICPVLAVLGPLEASAMNDWASTWPLIAVAAVLVRCRSEQPPPRGALIVAGASVGLAGGSKLSSLAAGVLLLAALLYCVPRGVRVRSLLWSGGAAIVTGAYWYVRDFVAVGNPVPNEHIPGLPRVPAASIDTYGYTVAHYFGNWGVIRNYYVPGLHWFFGPLWFVLLGLGVVGVVLSLARSTRIQRALGVVTILVAIVYVVTPTGALGLPGKPSLFRVNLRYAIPAVSLALLLAGISRLSRRWPRAFAASFVVLLAVALDRNQAWLTATHIVLPAVLVACCLVPVALLLPRLRAHAAAVAVAALVVVVAVGYPFNRSYLNDRYATAGTPQLALFSSLHTLTHTKIGVVGLPAIYPYLGATYSNQVSYVGRSLSNHAFVDYPTCRSWRAAVAAGGYEFVVVQLSPGGVIPHALSWTRTDPAARVVRANTAGAVFAVGDGFGSAPCPSA